MALSDLAATRARIAFQRFGLGARPGGPARIGDDPIAAVRAELDDPSIARIDDPGLPTYRQAARAAQQGYDVAEKIRIKELRARIDKHMSVEIGFVERLVLFWSNHFSMSINKAETVRGTIGQVERDVIRANVLGNFSTMLRGVIQHPAMLAYLDNENSMGPRSKTGIAWGAGLNENLGRELMELHTVGSGGGYTEADVTNMARVLTGWSYVRGWESDGKWNGGTAANRGLFLFRDDWHEPGSITVMGKTYAPDGLSQGARALADLARRRATAEHIAFKLVRHFITDEPSRDMVEPVADAFFDSRGDLKKTALALLRTPRAWTAPFTKVRTPYELAIAQFRALGNVPDDTNGWAFSEPLRALHHLPWERGAPDGFPDETAAWLDPDGMTIRLDTAMLAVDVFGPNVNRTPIALGRQLYDAALSDESRDALARLSGRREGFTLLFMTPEFQRR